MGLVGDTSVDREHEEPVLASRREFEGLARSEPLRVVVEARERIAEQRPIERQRVLLAVEAEHALADAQARATRTAIVERETQPEACVSRAEFEFARRPSPGSLELEPARRAVPGRAFEMSALEAAAVEEHVFRNGVLDRDREEDEDAEDR